MATKNSRTQFEVNDEGSETGVSEFGRLFQDRVAHPVEGDCAVWLEIENLFFFFGILNDCSSDNGFDNFFYFTFFHISILQTSYSTCSLRRQTRSALSL